MKKKNALHLDAICEVVTIRFGHKLPSKWKFMVIALSRVNVCREMQSPNFIDRVNIAIAIFIFLFF